MWVPPKTIESRLKEISKKPIPFFKKEEEIQEVIRRTYLIECKIELQHIHKTVSKNFTWLCKKHKVSKEKVRTDLQNTLGIAINKNAYNVESKSRLKTIAAPLTIAKYFNISLKDLMFSDLSIVDEILPDSMSVGEL